MKLVINKTQSSIFLVKLGMTIAATASHEISPIEYPLWAYDQQLIEQINNASITTSNGITEYTDPTEAIAFLRS